MPPRTHTITDAPDTGGDGPPDSDKFEFLFRQLDAAGKEHVIQYMCTMLPGMTA